MSEHLTIRWVNWLRQQHRSVCFENGWDAEEQGTAYSAGADALEAVAPLRDKVTEQAARIEALEAERDAAYTAGFEACRDLALSKARCEFIETASVRALQPHQKSDQKFSLAPDLAKLLNEVISRDEHLSEETRRQLRAYAEGKP